MATFFDTAINFESQHPNMGLIALAGAVAAALAHRKMDGD